MVKLNRELVLGILMDYHYEGLSFEHLSDKYGVTERHIHNIVTGQAWTEVYEEYFFTGVEKVVAEITGKPQAKRKYNSNLLQVLFPNGAIAEMTIKQYQALMKAWAEENEERHFASLLKEFEYCKIQEKLKIADVRGS
jgi:hypothetical protein